MSPIVDCAGHRFGRLVVLKLVEVRPRVGTIWLCQCDCGNQVPVPRKLFAHGKTKSCGCLLRDHGRSLPKRQPRHGHATKGQLTAEYAAWRAMRNRCGYPGDISYHRYGGRGIRVCERWNEFEAFLADIGKRPSRNHSLERKDNNGNYEPGNVRWATRKEQGRNTSVNRIVSIKGRDMTLAEAMETFAPHTPKGTITSRLSRGWDVYQAIFT